MIRLIEADRATPDDKSVLDAMFRNRAEIFGPMGYDWDVVVKDGKEVDTFDDANPLYVLSVCPLTGEYWASLRLLPTTGPNMLRDVFSQLLPPGDTVESATIWESSRICAERAATGALRELLVGIGTTCALAGLTQIVSVFDERIYRLLRMLGLKIEDLGAPQMIGGVKTRAGLFEFGQDQLDHYKAKWGIEA